ncbi:MAG: single-stranded-DNA-specific exonuclease RecJ [Microgenomates group bacterium]
MKWEILDKSPVATHKLLITVLLKNIGLKTKKEIDDFINPKDPSEIKFKDLGINDKSLKQVVKRLETAKKKKEKIVIFGDYDADGVCATAVLWEAMYKLGYDVMPFIPDRFEDGYGIKSASFENPKLIDLKAELIITVDNGIVAYNAVKEAKKLGIDVIVVDHHQKGEKVIGTPYVLHSTLVCGTALSWFLARELGSKDGLDLVALGTIADQMPLLGINRSLVKFGLPELTKTKRVGLQKLLKDSKIDKVGVYEVGYIIAPRINAMGRLAQATDSLRFLCTRDPKKAEDLNNLLNDTNIQRQKVVDDVLTRVLKEMNTTDNIVVIEGEYHEGVIGLASGKVTEKYYKPSIVFSRSEKISKASARSIAGFNIIEAIKETGLILEGGGHPMAAGFSIYTEKISEFRQKINEISQSKLTDEILERKLKIDLELSFDLIDKNLVDELKQFEPTGQGNYSPVFSSKNVKIIDNKTVGSDGKHLKLKLEQNGIKFDAIWFNAKSDFISSNPVKADVAFTVEENIWNNKTSIQLKIKDIKTM